MPHSTAELFRLRHRFVNHTVLYTIINGTIIVAWNDPQRVNLGGGLGLMLLTFVWTPLFIMHVFQFMLREWENRALKGGDQPSVNLEELLNISNYKTKTKEKRETINNGKIIQEGQFILYLHSRRVSTPHKGELKLTPIETKLIGFLMKFPNQPVSICRINQEVWGYETNDAIALKNTIYRLRQKLEITPDEPSYLIYIPNEGYAFITDVEFA